MDVIIVYDIGTKDRAGERLLARVARTCEGYGVRVQYSVFECRLTETSYVQLEEDLRRLIRPEMDRVTIYRITGNIEMSRTDLGARTWLGASDDWIL